MLKRGSAAFLALFMLAGLTPVRAAEAQLANPSGRVYVLPIRDDIMPPMVYLVRRGVKAAMESGAEVLVLDMETNGGRADSTLEIIDILSQFKGRTLTYVNQDAYSAGAFIAVATQQIYMAPQSVIGAAAPIMAAPGGAGVQEMPGTVEIKMTSALSAKIRAYAEKNGHNPEVVNAMINKQSELIIDDEVINPKGEILTLTDREAAQPYGNPPRPLLSAGTFETLDDLLAELGFANARPVRVEPTGAERLASWLNALNWLWLIIGVGGIYIEIKTPGFGLPGIVGISAFALYFLGSYIAGLAGLEWAAMFVLGLVLVILELFVWPGTVALGLTGVALMLVTVVMAMVDLYPGMPPLPSLPQLRVPLRDLTYAAIGIAIVIAILSRYLPRTPLYDILVTRAVSGVESTLARETVQTGQLGRVGVALTPLHPGGKARFGEDILDVITQGEQIARGSQVRILRHSLGEAIVEEARS